VNRTPKAREARSYENVMIWPTTRREGVTFCQATPNFVHYQLVTEVLIHIQYSSSLSTCTSTMKVPFTSHLYAQNCTKLLTRIIPSTHIQQLASVLVFLRFAKTDFHSVGQGPQAWCSFLGADDV
jgi:hypothetical protein